ncbi:ribonuclease H-like domain-containing protein [Tanacetum coccineum]
MNRGPNLNFKCNHCGKIGHTTDRCFEIIGFPQGFKRNPNTGKQTFNANSDVKMNTNSASDFTPEQMQKLLNMINDKSSGSIHANMAGQSNMIMFFHVSKLLRHNRLGHLADQVLSVLKKDLNISDNTTVPMCKVCQMAKQTREPFPLSDHKSKSLDDYSRAVWVYLVKTKDEKRMFDMFSDLGRTQSNGLTATQVGDQNWFERNSKNSIPNTSQSSPIQNNDEVQTPILRRSERQSKIPVRLNDYVLNSNVRLVAKGFSQKEGFDYDETFSPVIKMVIVRSIIAIDVVNNWPLYQLDVNNAFLYGDLYEDVYMTLPDGYNDENKSKVFITRNDDVGIKEFKIFLSTKFMIKDLGVLKYFLGIKIVENDFGLCMSQRKYCLELLYEYGLLAARPVDIPLPGNSILSFEKTANDKYLSDFTTYQKLVGDLVGKDPRRKIMITQRKKEEFMFISLREDVKVTG